MHSHQPPPTPQANVEGPTFAVALLDRGEVCRLFGGTRPLNASTLYRGIRAGRYPRPIKVGPGTSRWLLAECEAVLRKMTEARR
jgi:predicted DNA-binding transcriptional regulator AlpA